MTRSPAENWAAVGMKVRLILILNASAKGNHRSQPMVIGKFRLL